MERDPIPREREDEPAREGEPPLADRELNPGDPGFEQPEPRTPDDPAIDPRIPEDAIPNERGI
jgi:hypothetical protein